jgi:peptide-methionine (S)-S-oxide reductase
MFPGIESSTVRERSVPGTLETEACTSACSWRRKEFASTPTVGWIWTRSVGRDHALGDERAGNRTGRKEFAEMEKATFGGGCFWGVEATFRNVSGVVGTSVGYLGGTLDNPTYEDVCRGDTGHAEVVEVGFDPAKVSYESLLDVFWDMHDPTQLNRQGPDVGHQYRSAIFFHTPEQEARALASRAALEESGRHQDPIVTEITPASTFHRAEDYHQQYLETRGLASCTIPAHQDQE